MITPLHSLYQTIEDDKKNTRFTHLRRIKYGTSKFTSYCSPYASVEALSGFDFVEMVSWTRQLRGKQIIAKSSCHEIVINYTSIVLQKVLLPLMMNRDYTSCIINDHDAMFMEKVWKHQSGGKCSSCKVYIFFCNCRIQYRHRSTLKLAQK